MSTEFINIKSNALQALFTNALTEYDRKVYFTLCQNATFKHQVYGVYKRQTFWTLAKEVASLTKDKKKISQVQRSVDRLEAAGLLKVLFQSRDLEEASKKKIDPDHKELIISLDPAATLQSICAAIEQNIDDFNIYADRIRELERNLGVKLNIVKKNAPKLVAITNNELDEDSKIAGDLFPAQLHFFPEAAFSSSAIASARDSPR
ncbi:hypothetical protein [Paracidovorax cattleyae]|uniref:hypothetical protein n=1 Tax=Paracidovorax cattleyae TaxID=80868 RepID=UPI00115F8CAE|nr:hypothetical protein [Paracidovorax cattleyae]